MKKTMESRWLYKDLRWLERAKNCIDELEYRIDVVGKQFYSGCGFHYGLENTVEKLRKILWSYNDQTGLCELLTIRVSFTFLYQQVVKAEASAKEKN